MSSLHMYVDLLTIEGDLIVGSISSSLLLKCTECKLRIRRVVYCSFDLDLFVSSTIGEKASLKLDIEL